eukprot:4515118-Amphidinium_carterae.1
MVCIVHHMSFSREQTHYMHQNIGTTASQTTSSSSSSSGGLPSAFVAPPLLCTRKGFGDE